MPLYREVCGEVIELACPACEGKGVDIASLTGIFNFWKECANPAWAGQNEAFTFPACEKCAGKGHVSGPRCVLDRAHDGDHSPDLPADTGDAMVIEVEE
jgi:hypothetical protein